MAIVDSLKKLLTRFGGDVSALEENATSSDVIDAISEAYTDKEGTYVEVTPIGSEGTKIATITTNNTAHDIYAPESGSKVFEKFIVKTSTGAHTATLQGGKTIKDIYDTWFSGIIPVIITDLADSWEIYWPLCVVSQERDGGIKYMVKFTSPLIWSQSPSTIPTDPIGGGINSGWVNADETVFNFRHVDT